MVVSMHVHFWLNLI